MDFMKKKSDIRLVLVPLCFPLGSLGSLLIPLLLFCMFIIVFGVIVCLYCVSMIIGSLFPGLNVIEIFQESFTSFNDVFRFLGKVLDSFLGAVFAFFAVFFFFMMPCGVVLQVMEHRFFEDCNKSRFAVVSAVAFFLLPCFLLNCLAMNWYLGFAPIEGVPFLLGMGMGVLNNIVVPFMIAFKSKD